MFQSAPAFQRKKFCYLAVKMSTNLESPRVADLPGCTGRRVQHVQLHAPQLFATAAEIDALDMWSDTGEYLAEVWDVAAAVEGSGLDADLYNNYSGDLMQQSSGDELRFLVVQPEDLPTDATCYICLDAITTADRDNVQKLSCNHWFHAKCLQPWVMRKNTCPTCRSKHQPSF